MKLEDALPKSQKQWVAAVVILGALSGAITQTRNVLGWADSLMHGHIYEQQREEARQMERVKAAILIALEAADSPDALERAVMSERAKTMLKVNGPREEP